MSCSYVAPGSKKPCPNNDVVGWGSNPIEWLCGRHFNLRLKQVKETLDEAIEILGDIEFVGEDTRPGI